MKYLYVLLCSIAYYNLSDLNNPLRADPKQLACPETSVSDILTIHNFLTSSQFELNRKAAGIEEIKFDLDDLEKQHTDAFVTYWQERNVEIVSTSNICQSISKSLMLDNEISKYHGEFSPIYFRVKNLYVVLYKRKSGHIEKGKNPVQILDEDFRIISKYKI